MPAKRKKGREEHDDGVEKMVIGGNYNIIFVLVVFVILSREEKTRHWTDHTEPKPCDSAIFLGLGSQTREENLYDRGYAI